MANLAHSALSEQRVHGGETRAVQDLSVGHLVSPADTEDAVEAWQVENIYLPLLLTVGCPCLAPV